MGASRHHPGNTLWGTERALRASEAVSNRLRAEAIGTIETPAAEVYEVAFQG